MLTQGQNGYRDFPYVGGIAGFANDSPDLRTGSFNYVYIGGVSQSTLSVHPHTPSTHVTFLFPSHFFEFHGHSGSARRAPGRRQFLHRRDGRTGGRRKRDLALP